MLGCVVGGSTAGQPEQHHATPTLVADVHSVAPGQLFVLGIHFEIDPGWHLYWNGMNDSGMPIQVELKAPEGAETKSTCWPAPKRHAEANGFILDHIYEHDVTLLISVTAPDEAVPGSELSFTADLEWLACKNLCVAEEASVTVSIPVVADPAQSRANAGPAAGWIAAAKARLPKKWERAKSAVTLAESPHGVLIERPGAEKLYFYPFENSIAVIDLAKSGEVKGGKMPLRLDAPRGEATRLRGVIEVKLGDDQPSEFWEIDIDPAAPAGWTAGEREHG